MIELTQEQLEEIITTAESDIETIKIETSAAQDSLRRKEIEQRYLIDGAIASVRNDTDPAIEDMRDTIANNEIRIQESAANVEFAKTFIALTSA